MTLGLEVALGPNDIVLDGDPAHPHQKRGTAPIFWPCLLWPNGWMDQDIAAPTHLFGTCIFWPNGCPSQQLLRSCFVKSNSLLANKVIISHVGFMETDVLYGVEYETDKFFICGVISILL